jgi:hypothetical protein
MMTRPPIEISWPRTIGQKEGQRMRTPTTNASSRMRFGRALLVLGVVMGVAQPGAAQAPAGGLVTPAVFVPVDETITDDEVAQVDAGLRLAFDWYRRQLGDRELNVAPLVVVHGKKTSAEYREGAIWSEAPTEIAAAVGHPAWSAGYIELILGRGRGWAGAPASPTAAGRWWGWSR